MAIRPSLNVAILLSGDGTSTSVTVNFDDIPVMFPTVIQPNFNFKGLHPAVVIPVTLDGSTANLPSASVSGTNVTFNFPSALDTSAHRLECRVDF